MKNRLFVFALLLGLIVCAVNTSASEAIKKAEQLFLDKDYKQALAVLQDLAEDNDAIREDPDFLLLYADTARLRAPGVPILNGGDRIQMNLYRHAHMCYGKVKQKTKPNSDPHRQAELGQQILIAGLIKQAADAEKAGHDTRVFQFAEVLIELVPDKEVGPALMFNIATKYNNPEMQLMALRAHVKAKPKKARVYSSAAYFEGTPKVGGGAEASLKHIDAGLAVLPNEYTLLGERVNYLIRLKRDKEALAALKAFEAQLKVAFKDEQRRATYVGFAASYYDQLGMQDEAESRYRWVVKHRPDDLRNRYFLGTLYFQRGMRHLHRANLLRVEEEDGAEQAEAAGKKAMGQAREQLEYCHKHSEKPDVAVMSALADIYARQKEEKLFLKMRQDIKKVRNGEPIR